MPESDSKSKKRMEEVAVPQLRFCGEQDGPAERDLKSRLTQLFRRDRRIDTAYLARVTYAEESVAVALCLGSSSGPDPHSAEEVGNIFSSMFGRHERLDIIFLTDAQETELAAVCKPFFRAQEKS